jgi:hypothetical protein
VVAEAQGLNASNDTRRQRYPFAAHTTGDAQRFLVLSSLAREAVQPTSVVLHWPETLRR